MRYIYKLFHEKSSSDFNEIYQRRLQNETTIKLGLNIKPMSQPHLYELYYVPTNEMLTIVNKIHLVSRQFQRTFEGLPAVAQKQFVNECLVEELYHTNDLEGIRSSKEEIARSTREVLVHKKSKIRFESMIKSYYRLLNKNLQFPKTPQDIRQIYDDITNDEIDQQELPDGEIFRKEITYILKKSGSSKVIHQGIMPEAAIIRALKELLEFMQNDNNIPLIIKVAIGHYFFGYIHPFYDGNGRTSRFISSMYLAEELDSISALSLSSGCNQYKNKYLDAFEVTNSIKSRGELNYFIETFLNIILDALIQMNAGLKEKDELFRTSLLKLKQEKLLDNYGDEYKEIMFVLAQNHFFDTHKGVTIKELAEIISKSEATVRKMIKELVVLSLIEKKGERPAFYCMKQRYFEE